MKSLFAKTLFLFALFGASFLPCADLRAQEAAAATATATAAPLPSAQPETTAEAPTPPPALENTAPPMLAPEGNQQEPQKNLVSEERTSTRSKLTQYLVTDDLVSEDGYERATYERLSKLYWALAMFDLKDNQAIDQYLMINECDLYMKFYNDDLALEDLRNVTRDSIVHNLAKAPRTYEIMMPVGLDRYDKATRRFKIYSSSLLVGTKKLEVTLNTIPRMICDKQGPLPKYAWNFILAFSRPFTLTEIPMPPEEAQNYIDFAKEEFDKSVSGKYFEYRDLSPQFRRIVFLRLKVTMSQFKEMGRNYGDETVPIIFATIDGFQIYGDVERTKLLYDQEEENRKKMDRLKNSADDREKHRQEIPQGQLLESKDQDSNAYVPQSSYLPTSQKIE